MTIQLSPDALVKENEIIHRKYGHSVLLNANWQQKRQVDPATASMLATLDMITGHGPPSNLIKLIPRQIPFFNLENTFLFNKLTAPSLHPEALIISALWEIPRAWWKYYDVLASYSSQIFSSESRPSSKYFNPANGQHEQLALPIFDGGNLDFFCPESERVTIVSDVYRGIGTTKIIPITIGGEHQLTYYIVKNMRQNLGPSIPLDLIIFDAHLDMGESKNDFLHCGNWVTALLDCSENLNIYYYGVRDLECMRKIPSNVHFNAPYPSANNHYLYLSLDVDYFDPSLVSSVAYPVPNGANWRDFLSVIGTFNFSKVIGIDIVEYQAFRNIEAEHLFLGQLLFEFLKRLG